LFSAAAASWVTPPQKNTFRGRASRMLAKSLAADAVVRQRAQPVVCGRLDCYPPRTCPNQLIKILNEPHTSTQEKPHSSTTTRAANPAPRFLFSLAQQPLLTHTPRLLSALPRISYCIAAPPTCISGGVSARMLPTCRIIFSLIPTCVITGAPRKKKKRLSPRLS